MEKCFSLFKTAHVKKCHKLYKNIGDKQIHEIFKNFKPETEINEIRLSIQKEKAIRRKYKKVKPFFSSW